MWQALSHRLGRAGWGRTSLFVDYFVRWWFGCFLPGSATLGEGVRAGYGGIGIVVHKQARIGARTIIGPGVVIGGNGVQLGVPEIGEDVLIGAGAKLLGPIRVGNRCRIGANAVVLTDVPDDCVAVGVPALVKARQREQASPVRD